jgi:basic amino acid/polyamine antiporter, APA family
MIQSQSNLQRRLGLFDATMIVMGGIVGSGIFINPYVVAQQVHTPFLILGAWICGGVIALAGSFIYAELSARRPEVGGQYAYLREAYHPSVAFMYAWGLLLVTQSGGMAAVAVTFAHYFLELLRWQIPGGIIAALMLGVLTLINCLGVRAGSAVQSALMVLKIAAIASLVACGLLWAPHSSSREAVLAGDPVSVDFWTSFGAAMVPVLFAYGGWQTSCFIAGEVIEPRKNLPRGLMIGVAGVIVLYLSVNYVCLRVLGPSALAETRTPASAVMKLALGETGARWIALGIAVSTLGFLSQGILTAPRVYFAMAADGLFFKSVAKVHPHTHVPVMAIALQGMLAAIIAMSGRYEQILNYVVSVDFIFFGLTATCVFVFRRRERRGNEAGYRIPGHPLTTLLFIASCWLVVAATVFRYPANSAVGLGILAAGIPAYLLWSRQASLKKTARTERV